MEKLGARGTKQDFRNLAAQSLRAPCRRLAELRLNIGPRFCSRRCRGNSNIF